MRLRDRLELFKIWWRILVLRVIGTRTKAEPPSKLPRAHLVSDWSPKDRRIHGPWNCAMIGWCHECDEYPPPCCEECRYFGPCSECDARRQPRDCRDSRCKRKECLDLRRQEQEEWAIRTY